MAQLDSTDEALVAAMASGMNVSKAAGQLGIAPSTAYRRAAQPAFRAALAEARGDRWRPRAERAALEVDRSLAVLAELRDGNGHPSTRLRAAVALIELACDLDKLAEHEPRLARLEAELALMEQQRGTTTERDE